MSNIVDVGVELFDATSVDNYVKSLVNHIGKVIFVNRPYAGNVPSMLMDSWEFGSVLEKISADIPEATSATQLNGFLSMLYNAVDKSMSIKIDSLIMRTINNAIGETFYADDATFSGDYTSASTNRCVNLLKLYNEKFGTTLTADKAITTPEFIRFASYTMSLYVDRLSKISSLFNVGGKDRFTPADMLHIVMLSDFKASATAYLESDTFHNNLVALPESESVPYWQGSGSAYGFADVSKIVVKTATGHDITATGILAVMFDRDAMGVCNSDRRVTTNYNAKAEFYNNYYKFDASYYNDLNENCVVFYVA